VKIYDRVDVAELRGTCFWVTTPPDMPTTIHSRSYNKPFSPNGHCCTLNPAQLLMGYTVMIWRWRMAEGGSGCCDVSVRRAFPRDNNNKN